MRHTVEPNSRIGHVQGHCSNRFFLNQKYLNKIQVLTNKRRYSLASSTSMSQQKETLQNCFSKTQNYKNQEQHHYHLCLQYFSQISKLTSIIRLENYYVLHNFTSFLRKQNASHTIYSKNSVCDLIVQAIFHNQQKYQILHFSRKSFILQEN